VIAQACNVVALMVMLRRGAIPDVRFSLRPRRIDRGLAVELYRVGWPAALDMLVLNAGFIAALGMLGRIDEDAVAAHGLGLRIQGLAFVPGLGVSQATAAMIGQALGAGDVERARRIARASMLLCVTIMGLIAFTIMITASPIVTIFNVSPDEPIGFYAIEWLRLLGLAMVPAGVNLALTGAFQGAGATRTSLWINFTTTIGLNIPVGILLGFGFGMGETGVWLSLPLVAVIRVTVFYAVFQRERWAVVGVKV
jgi:Na+-driven multidrug efflux pump